MGISEAVVGNPARIAPQQHGSVAQLTEARKIPFPSFALWAAGIGLSFRRSYSAGLNPAAPKSWGM